MRAVLNGDAFRSSNIERFVEDDFFHWVHADAYFDRLKPMFREIARRIQEFDFTNVAEDILKGVYQELIDLDTRHALGEYYNPDWLCEKVVASLDFQPGSRVLDPACGSGSFLRAAVARLREIDPKRAARSSRRRSPASTSTRCLSRSRRRRCSSRWGTGSGPRRGPWSCKSSWRTRSSFRAVREPV
jgi:hypothetical protein